MVIYPIVKIQIHLETDPDTQIQLSYHRSNENLLYKILVNVDKGIRIWPSPLDACWILILEMEGIMARKYAGIRREIILFSKAVIQNFLYSIHQVLTFLLFFFF